MSIWIVLLLLFNFGISWWNAVVAGKVWDDSLAMGTFMRLVTWSAAIMSACGFTMVISVILALLGHAVVPHYVPERAVEAILSMTYVAIILPILGSGLVITIQSWITAIRERSILDMSVAGYNTFAMVHNTVEAFDGIPGAIGQIVGFFSSDDDDEDGIVKTIVLSVVLFSLLAGVLLTYTIVNHYRGSLPLPARDGKS